MSKYIICLCEGEVTEPSIINNLTQHFLKESTIQVVYGTAIYTLYRELLNNDVEIDEYLDLIEILKEKKRPKKRPKEKKYPELKNISRDDKLQVLLKTFNNETEKGKLYVSYPMVEALRHIKDEVSFENLSTKSSSEYKEESKNCDKQLIDFEKYTKDIWIKLIYNHCKKANSIIGYSFTFPDDIIEQLLLFEKQMAYKKQIEHKEKVAVLSAFPLFLLDYYGAEKLKSIQAKE